MKLTDKELQLLIGMFDYCNFDDAEPKDKEVAEKLLEKIEQEVEERQQVPDYDMSTHVGRTNLYNALLYGI